MIKPILIGKILGYFDGTLKFQEAMIYTSLLAFLIVINGIIHHPYFLGVQQYGMKMRIACSGIIYKKVKNILNSFNKIELKTLYDLIFKQISKLSLAGKNDQLGGQILNMIANDGSRIELSVYFLPYLLIGPIQAIIIIIMLIKLIDLSVLSGLIVMMITIPAQTLLAKIYDRLR